MTLCKTKAEVVAWLTRIYESKDAPAYKNEVSLERYIELHWREVLRLHAGLIKENT